MPAAFLVLEVPPDPYDNIRMLNMKQNKSEAIEHFVIYYGEMSAAYNERMMDYDPIEILEEGWANEYIREELGLTKEELPEVLEMFNRDFEEPENEYGYTEVKAIRKWIGEKFYA